MLTLGIETSCDETAAAVIDEKLNILSNIVASQIDIHKEYGGVVPEIASRAHIENIMPVIDSAIRAAKIKLSDIGAVAATAEPGLPGAVMVGRVAGESLATALGVPYLPVNHLHGHAASLRLSNPDLRPPFLCLLVSGGHTAIYSIEANWQTKLLLSTADDAAGEAFDKVARVLGLSYPGGPKISAEAAKCHALTAAPFVPKFPKDKFSFSGLKTAVLNFVNTEKQHARPLDVPQICANFQTCAVNQLLERSLEQIKKHGSRAFGICGGVAANAELRRRFAAALCELNVKLYLPAPELCGDNAAMIAAAAVLAIK